MDSLAIDCLMQELKVTQDKNLKSYYPEDIRYRLYQNSGYKPMLTLVGLFNSVSKNQLTLEHFGVSHVNDDYKEINRERANIFKNKFYAYIDVLSDNRYNEDAQDFTEKDIDKILDSYIDCLNICLDGFEMGCIDDKAKVNKAQFIEYMSFATADEYVYNGLLKFIKFNDEQKAETLSKIAERTIVVENRFQQILQEYQAKSENQDFLELISQSNEKELNSLFTPKHLENQATIIQFQKQNSGREMQGEIQNSFPPQYAQNHSPFAQTQGQPQSVSGSQAGIQMGGQSVSGVQNAGQVAKTSVTDAYIQSQTKVSQSQEYNTTIQQDIETVLQNDVEVSQYNIPKRKPIFAKDIQERARQTQQTNANNQSTNTSNKNNEEMQKQ